LPVDRFGPCYQSAGKQLALDVAPGILVAKMIWGFVRSEFIVFAKLQ
jgi:hypothetical protein